MRRSSMIIIILAEIAFSVILLPAAESRATLTGKVVDAAGKPLAHAVVMVYQGSVKHGYSTSCPTCYVDCGKRAITAADGSYKISGLSADLKFTILTVMNGFFPQLTNSVDPLAGPASVITLKSREPINDPQRVIRARVIDARGRPLRDAVVQPQGILFNDEKQRRIASYGTIAGLDLIAVTNEKGIFEIAYNRPAIEVLILVEARGFAPKLFNHIPPGLDVKNLKVSSGATLRGRLIDNGKPVGSALMGLMARKRSMGAELKLDGDPYSEMRVGTKPDGTFEFTNVPDSVKWYVYGKMESIRGSGATGPVECVTKKDGDDVSVGDIQIKPGFKLRGKVILSDGKPIPDGMRVSIYSEKSQDAKTMMLGSNGSFEFTGIVPDKYEVFASVRGYQPPQWDYRTQTDPPGTLLLKGDTDDFLLTLNPIK